jgi:hypothetical protein
MYGDWRWRFLIKINVFELLDDGTRIALFDIMEANIHAMVSEYAEVSFSGKVEMAGPESGVSAAGIQLRVPANALSHLIEKNMPCRIEFPDKTLRKVKVSEIERKSGELVLFCRTTK